MIICILFLARQDSLEQNEVNGLSGTLRTDAFRYDYSSNRYDTSTLNCLSEF